MSAPDPAARYTPLPNRPAPERLVHILVLTDCFHPEIAPPSFRIMDHARYWLRAGHRVTVVTGAPNRPSGKVFAGYRNDLWTTEDMEGVQVIRLWSYMSANEGFLRRTLDYGSLMASQILAAPFYPDVDVILATSPPLQTAIAGSMIARARNKPWIFEVRDLWPASIKAVGAADGPLLDFLEGLELRLYRDATRVVLLTSAFERDLLERRIPGHKLDVVTNGVDLDAIRPDPEGAARIRAHLGLSATDVLFGYIGTTGMAHGLETVLDAATRLRDQPHLRWLILGEGAARAGLEQRAIAAGLTNVTFHDFVPHAEVLAWTGACDVAVVHLKPDPLFKTVIPSKIFEAMALERPILMAVEGEAADLVRQAGAGVCIPSGDSYAMADAALNLAANPADRASMGRSGRLAAERHHSRRSKAEALLRVFERAIAEFPGSR